MMASQMGGFVKLKDGIFYATYGIVITRVGYKRAIKGN